MFTRSLSIRWRISWCISHSTRVACIIMNSDKLSRYFTYLLLLIGFTAILARDADTLTSAQQDVASEGEKSNCSCGGFPTETPTEDAQPILSQAPGLEVACNAGAEAACGNLCTALAVAAKAKGPEVICKRIKNADELKLSVFYKVCDKPWTFAGMTAEKAMCCEDGQVKQCASDDVTPSTLDVDLTP
ncbi:hypothetical protein EVAR_95309_1 [Eumeta japonica]|uniref:Follicle cell protein 3C-1 n=1 Tax=Eumeta variegata TaxID=151549 RepID=A0A4C1U9B2_EUMVA|nr:hypothetical protein EVAR_95309_1 [Eumeta japonica]